jgi:hypothetical protein
MAYSYAVHTGNGSNRLFSIPFPYLDKAHISVTVDGNLTTAFTWVSASQILMNSAPAGGVSVRISRDSSRNQRLTNFQDAQVLTEAQLDFDANQLFYVAQEAFDSVAGAASGGDMRRSNNLSDVYSSTAALANIGGVNRYGDTMFGPLTLSGAPTASNHAATKGYVDQVVGGVNSGVFSFQGRTGNVSLQLGDVQGALGYTPLNRNGGSMYGYLYLYADPAQDLHAATKGYVDRKMGTAVGSITTFNGRPGPAAILTEADVVNILNNAELVGPLRSQVGVEPGNFAQLTTKQYVDTAIQAAALGTTTTHVTKFNGRYGDVVLQPSDLQSAMGTGEAVMTYFGGGTIVNQIAMTNHPTADHHLATKWYVDDKISTSSGGVTGFKTPTGLTRTGLITLEQADVNEALGYIPVSYAGSGTFQAQIEMDTYPTLPKHLATVQFVADRMNAAGAGEVNTAASMGGTASLVSPKSGTVLPFRGITGSANLQVVQGETDVTLTPIGLLTVNNCLGDVLNKQLGLNNLTQAVSGVTGHVLTRDLNGNAVWAAAPTATGGVSLSLPNNWTAKNTWGTQTASNFFRIDPAVGNLYIRKENMPPDPYCGENLGIGADITQSSGSGLLVGMHMHAESGGSHGGNCWGFATEAWNMPGKSGGSYTQLFGGEVSIIQTDKNNYASRHGGMLVVFKNRLDTQTSPVAGAGVYNRNASAVYIDTGGSRNVGSNGTDNSATAKSIECGWNKGIYFSAYSLDSAGGVKAIGIDFSDLDGYDPCISARYVNRLSCAMALPSDLGISFMASSNSVNINTAMLKADTNTGILGVYGNGSLKTGTQVSNGLFYQGGTSYYLDLHGQTDHVFRCYSGYRTQGPSVAVPGAANWLNVKVDNTRYAIALYPM